MARAASKAAEDVRLELRMGAGGLVSEEERDEEEDDDDEEADAEVALREALSEAGVWAVAPAAATKLVWSVAAREEMDVRVAVIC